MPPKVKITKEEIIAAAVELVREDTALSARNIAKRLSCSTQPIFSNYRSMSELIPDITKAVYKIYLNQIAADMGKGKYPPYKASGMSYIDFARGEPGLFRFLFMRDRRGEEISEILGDPAAIEPIIRIIMEKNGFSREEATLLHEEMWVFVHGLASMVITNFLPWDEKSVSNMLTDAYFGLCARSREKRKENENVSDRTEKPDEKI